MGCRIAYTGSGARDFFGRNGDQAGLRRAINSPCAHCLAGIEQDFNSLDAQYS
jgi:hypothetical protein